MTRKNEALTVGCNQSSREKLEKMAYELGYRWGAKGNISRLLLAIASGELTIQQSPNDNRRKLLESRPEVQEYLKLIEAEKPD